MLCEELEPPEADAIACNGSITNPYNGNQCGYFVKVFLETDQDRETVVAYYSRVASAELPGVDLNGEAHVDFVEHRAGGWIVTVLTVGDEGLDPRCM